MIKINLFVNEHKKTSSYPYIYSYSYSVLDQNPDQKPIIFAHVCWWLVLLCIVPRSLTLQTPNVRSLTIEFSFSLNREIEWTRTDMPKLLTRETFSSENAVCTFVFNLRWNLSRGEREWTRSEAWWKSRVTFIDLTCCLWSML